MEGDSRETSPPLNWLPPRRTPPPPPAIRPCVLLVPLVCIFILLFLPSFHRALRSGSAAGGLIKNGWDALNFVLVLFAILCGILSRNPSAADHQQYNSPRRQEWLAYTPSATPKAASFHTDDSTAEPSTTFATHRRVRSSSSYPDLRHHEVWAPADEWRISDDLQLHHRANRCWDSATPAPVRTIPVDTFVIRSNTPPPSPPPPTQQSPPTPPPPPPLPTLHPRRRAVKKVPSPNPEQEENTFAPLPPKLARVPPTPPPPPPPTRQPRRRAVKKVPAPNPEQEENTSQPPLLQPARAPPPPPPRRPPPTPPRDPKRLHQRKKSGGAKDLASALAQFYQKKRKKSSRHKKDSGSGGGDGHVSPPDSADTATPPPPPPPPPSPPSTVFNKLFSHKKSGSKSKRFHSAAPASAPTPPPPPVQRQRKQLYQRPPTSPHSVHWRRERSSYRSSPLVPTFTMPPPPPPPPEAAAGEGGEDGGRVFCPPSPDVNNKADMFIARFHAGLKLEKLNSLKQKQGQSQQQQEQQGEDNDDGETMIIGGLFDD